MDPFSGFAAGINTSIRIFEVTYQLKAVGEQTADLLSITRHVGTNLNEARRLRRQKVALLDAGERNWIDAVISDTDIALRSVAQLIEPACVDNTVKSNNTFGNKVLWVFRDNPKVRDKHARLTVCHQSLTTVISCLYSKDLVVIAPMPEKSKEDQPPPYDPQMEELFNWRKQRKQRKSFMSLRDADVERLISTSSMSTDSCSTSTTVTSPTSGFSVPRKPLDKRSQSTASAPACAPFTQPTSPFSSPRLGIVKRPISVSSVSTSTMFANPMSSVVSLMGGDDERPMSANWGPTRSTMISPLSENNLSPSEAPPRSTMISPMRDANLSPPEAPPRSIMTSPMSDTNISPPEGREEPNKMNLSFLHRRLNSQTSTPSEPERSNLGTNNPYFNSTDSLPLHHGTSSTASWVNHHSSYASPPQTTPPVFSNASTSNTIALPDLPEIDSSPAAIITTGYSSNDSNSGLQIQQVYKPYRRPNTAQQSQNFAAPSNTSTPFIFSTGGSRRPERSYSDGQSPCYDPPRFPGDQRYNPSLYNPPQSNPSSFMAELDSNVGEHASGESMTSQAGRPTSGVPSSIRRGGRSWLMFHATRSDFGHTMG